MKRPSIDVLGLVVSVGLCVGSTGYLIAMGLRLDALTGFATAAEIYLGGGGLLAGVLGLPVFLGRVLRPAEPVRAEIQLQPDDEAP